MNNNKSFDPRVVSLISHSHSLTMRFDVTITWSDCMWGKNNTKTLAVWVYLSIYTASGLRHGHIIRPWRGIIQRELLVGGDSVSSKKPSRFSPFFLLRAAPLTSFHSHHTRPCLLIDLPIYLSRVCEEGREVTSIVGAIILRIRLPDRGASLLTEKFHGRRFLKIF